MTWLIRRYRETQGTDQGFSLPELLVVTLIMGIVSLTLLTTLTALTNTSASTNSKANALAETRLAIENIARDLRAANPVDPIAGGLPTSVYDTKVAFKVFCTSGPACLNGLRQVSYEVVANQLSQTRGSADRELLEPTDTPSLPATLRRGAVLNSASEPVFTYLDRNGAPIATSTTVGAGRPSTYFRDCTKRVLIHLKVRSKANDPSAIVELKTAVQLRNYNEVNPC
ncbi:MAG: PulJ/GspJ family protein [Acidimicrobiales bacterium]